MKKKDLLLALCGGMAVIACVKMTAPEMVGDPPPYTAQAETPAEYFETETVQGGISILGCTSADAVIVVPAQINGEDVVKIANYAFSEGKMAGVVLPDSVQSVGYGAFADCTELQYVELGAGLKSIGGYAFTSCGKLERVKFPEGMQTIAASLFMNNEALREIVIPASVTELPGGIGIADSCPNAIVVTPEGSAAQQAAQEDGLPVRNK